MERKELSELTFVVYYLVILIRPALLGQPSLLPGPEREQPGQVPQAFPDGQGRLQVTPRHTSTGYLTQNKKY